MNNRKATAARPLLAIFVVISCLAFSEACTAIQKPQQFVYSAKYLCGQGPQPSIPTIPLFPYLTIVELQNPHDYSLPVNIKIVEDLGPDDVPPEFPKSLQLGPNEALEIDCEDSATSANWAQFRKGFVVVEAPEEIAVVAFYHRTDTSIVRDFEFQTSVATKKKTVDPRVPPGTPTRVVYSSGFECGRLHHDYGDLLRSVNVPDGVVDTDEYETYIIVNNLLDRDVEFSWSMAEESGVVKAVSRQKLGAKGVLIISCEDLPGEGTDFRIGSVIIETAKKFLEVEEEVVIIQISGGAIDNSVFVSDVSALQVMPVKIFQ